MIRLLTLSFLLLLMVACSDDKADTTVQADPVWATLANPDNESFSLNRKNDDIFFLNTQTGFVLSSSGRVFKTTNEGNSWEMIFAEDAYLRCMGWADEMNGWVGNLNGQEGDILYQTRDGGQTWSLVDGLLEAGMRGLCGISVVDSDVIYGAGRVFGPAHVIKTLDGGDNWLVIDMSDHAGFLIDIRFTDALNGMVIGGSDPDLERSTAVLLTTDDGGQTWTRRYQADRLNEWGWKFSFPTASVGYASLQTYRDENDPDGEYFLKTTDGGTTWTEMPFFYRNYSAQAIGFATTELGWMGSWHADKPTLVTRDGGETWTEAGFGNRLNRVRFLNNRFAYGVGSFIYKYAPPQ